MAKDYNDSDGRWVTISGRKVFIAEGQSLGDAMKKSGKFGNVSKVKGTRKNSYKDKLDQESKNKFLMGEGIDKKFVKGYAKDRQDEEKGYKVEEHNLSKDLFGKEAENRMSQKQKDLEKDLNYVRDIMAGKKVIDDKYHEELSLDTAKHWLRNDYVYTNGLSSYDPKVIDEKLAKEYPDIFGSNNKDVNGSKESSISDRDVKDLFNQLNDEGSDFSYSDARIEDDVLKAEVGVFMPREDGYTTREIEVPLKDVKNYNDLEEKMRDWEYRHSSPDTFYDKDFDDKKEASNRTYEQVNKEWKDQAKKMEKNYKEFGSNTVDDEKKLNDLSRERDSMQYKLSSKEVKDANAKYESDEIKQDVLENFGEDYDASRTPEENLRDQIDYMRNPRETLQQTCERYVEGGGYLVYNDDIKEYLDKHNIKYNDDNFFDKYKQTMADKMVEVYNGDSKSEESSLDEDDLSKVKRIQNDLSKKDNLTKEEKEWKDQLSNTQKRLEKGDSRENIIKDLDAQASNGYTKDEQDILYRYSEDYGYDKGDNLKNLKGQIDYMRNPGDSIHRTAERLVEGGDFLIYNGDVKDYLDERGIKYNEDNFFDKYKKDMADKIERLYNSESPKTSNKSMNESIRGKVGKTKADRNIDAFDDTRDFDQKEYDRRWKGKEINYDKPGKIGNMDVKDYANQRKEYLGKVDKLYKDENYEGKYKKLSDKTKSGEMTKKQFYNARAKLVDAMQRKQNQISKDYSDEVVSNNKKQYSQESPVIKNAIKRMSESSRAKTQKARERLRNELSPKATERYGNSVMGRTQELRMFNAWKEYNQKHPNSQMTLETFKKKYKG